MKHKKLLFLIIFIINCQFALSQATDSSEQAKSKFYNDLINTRISAINKSGDIKLKDYNGVTVVVFLAAWCKPCVLQALEMKMLQTEFGKNDLRIIGLGFEVEKDGKSALQAMTKKYKFNYPIGWTQDDKLAESLMKLTNFHGIPQTVVIYNKQIAGFFLGGSKTVSDKLREVIKTIINKK